MKLIIVTCALVAVAIAAPPAYPPPPPSSSSKEPPQVVRSEFKQEADGSYTSNVETNDGYHREESGRLEEVLNEEGKPVKVIIVRGSYGYNDPEGKHQDIKYTGDQDGFHAEGDSIPTTTKPSRR